jgi:hypothetical protein
VSLRDRLVAIADRARAVPDQLGLRPEVVKLRVTTWTGGVPGRGTPTHVDTEIRPTPKRSAPDPRRRSSEGGVTEAGEVELSRISRTLSRETLEGATCWLIGGEEYSLLSLTEKTTQWRAVLARRARGRV